LSANAAALVTVAGLINLHWTENRATPQYWWCRYRTQTRNDVSEECPERKPQQKILRA